MYKTVITIGKQNFVLRVADNAFIPFDPANTDYQAFVQYLNSDSPTILDENDKKLTAAKLKTLIANLP